MKKPVEIISCYEAGYDGFWLHRLEQTQSELQREKRDQKERTTQLHLQPNGGRDIIVARHALSPSTPRAFRRDPPGSGGVTAQRGQARRSAVPSMQNCACASLSKRKLRN